MLVIAYMIIPFYFVAHMMHMEDSGMAPMSDCPYSIGQYSVCPLDFAGHLNVWQEVSVVSAPSLFISVVYLIAVFSIALLALSIVKLLSYLKNNLRKKLYILYQELFSQGILNTKAY